MGGDPNYGWSKNQQSMWSCVRYTSTKLKLQLLYQSWPCNERFLTGWHPITTTTGSSPMPGSWPQPYSHQPSKLQKIRKPHRCDYHMLHRHTKRKAHWSLCSSNNPHALRKKNMLRWKRGMWCPTQTAHDKGSFQCKEPNMWLVFVCLFWVLRNQQY